MDHKPNPVRLGIISLGCAKNLVDTEVLLGQAAASESVICANPKDAEVVVVNTCGFIDQAREESLDAIQKALRWKDQGLVQKVIVAGCMAQRYGNDIRTSVPGIDSIIGMSEYQQFQTTLKAMAKPSKQAAEQAQTPWRTTLVNDNPNYDLTPQTARLRVTPRHYAYLKISEGCSNACTFCAIPNFRGLFRSKAREVVLTEARELVASGARELNLISQDTTHYGLDLQGETWQTGLARLLDDLGQIEELRWIRLLYAYPGHVSDELLEAMAEHPKVVPYLDMPIQHINSRILKRMGRRHSRQETEDLLLKCRERVPDIVLRTTFIVGFPGETEAEYQELEDFVREFKFERLGVFPYSHEKNTAAGEHFSDDVPKEVKIARHQALMQAQQPVAFAWCRSQQGKTLNVLLEAPLRNKAGKALPGQYLGRTQWDAPEIDPVITVEAPIGLALGEFVQVEVTGTVDYDLIGKTPGMEV